jgi:hypothetical protein
LIASGIPLAVQSVSIFPQATQKGAVQIAMNDGHEEMKIAA